MKRRALIIFLTAVCILSVNVYAEESTNENDYQRAMEYINSGDYDLAISIFEILDGYSDSKSQIAICQDLKAQMYYDEAVKLYESGQYDSAKDVFTMLGDYKDSAVQIIVCNNAKKQKQYEEALALMEEEKYDQAREIFEMLGSFQDCEGRLDQIDNKILEKQYNKAKEIEDTGDYQTAIEIYQQLDGYSDSDSRIEFCQDQIYRASLAEKVEETLEKEPFSADTVYDLLKESIRYELDEEQINTWYEKAYEKETGLMGGKTPVYRDTDIDSDGISERILVKGETLIIERRTEDGLKPISETTAESYTSLDIQTDSNGRQYLLGVKEDKGTIFLIGEELKAAAEVESIKNSRLTFTDTGFMITRTLTEKPLRQKRDKYIVEEDGVEKTELPLLVDMSSYPKTDSLKTLIKLYKEALTFESAEELAALVSSTADQDEMTALNTWLEQNGEIVRADIIIWNEEEKEFIGLIQTAENKLQVSVVLNDNGNFTLSGFQE